LLRSAKGGSQGAHHHGERELLDELTANAPDEPFDQLPRDRGQLRLELVETPPGEPLDDEVAVTLLGRGSVLMGSCLTERAARWCGMGTPPRLFDENVSQSRVARLTSS
jgi:hypothetical protein